jgi:copper chaperone CopZ
MKSRLLLLLTLFVGTGALSQPTEYRFRVSSLFQPDRVNDLRVCITEQLPNVLVSNVDFETATATFTLETDSIPQLKKDPTPEKARSHLSQLLRSASKGVFDVLPLSDIPPAELVTATIPVVGLDCKGCSYGAYRVVARVDGADSATASFSDGSIRVRFDRRKTSLETLEAALGQARIMTHHRITDPRAVPPSEMRIVRCSSEETSRDEVYAHSTGHAVNVIDGDPLTKWSSKYSGTERAEPPHELVIDLGRRRKVVGFTYLPRQIGYVGHFARTEFRVSDASDAFGEPVAAETTFTAAKSPQSVLCKTPVQGRYVLVRILSELNGKPIAAAAEIAVLQAD